MTSVLIAAAATTVEEGTTLPYSAVTFGVIALIAFVALLGLTWSFRGTSNKHR